MRHDNPAWLDTAITHGWSTILRESRGVPLVRRQRSGRLHVEELGCGVYGCVLPTDVPEVVVKVTVDSSEARFVSLVLGNRRLQSPGLTEYYAIERLPGARKLKWDRKPRQIFALWRAAAHDVGNVEGKLFGRSIPPALRREVKHFLTRADRFQTWASELQDIDLESKVYLDEQISASELEAGAALVSVDDGLDVGLEAAPKGSNLRAASLIAACRTEAVLMASYAPEAGGLVGQTLLGLLSADVILADVHAGNLGRLAYGGPYGRLVIIDPGHAVMLSRTIDQQADQSLLHADRPHGIRTSNPLAQANVVSLSAYQRT